jgi:hypothetical protein
MRDPWFPAEGLGAETPHRRERSDREANSHSVWPKRPRATSHVSARGPMESHSRTPLRTVHSGRRRTIGGCKITASIPARSSTGYVNLATLLAMLWPCCREGVHRQRAEVMGCPPCRSRALDHISHGLSPRRWTRVGAASAVSDHDRGCGRMRCDPLGADSQE